MFIKKGYITICGALLITIISTAQTTINSVVKSKDGKEELSGVTITNKATNKSVLSNNKGEFSIDITDLKEELKITYLGFETLTLLGSKVSNVVYLNSSLESLNQVVLSASRTKEKKHDVPVAISVVSKKTLQEMQPNDVSEVLNQKPGVHMVDLGNEQHMMAIRQPISTKSVFLYLEDGLPIRPTGVFNHNALLEMNMSALENIEIIRGAYSSLYGSEAIGGAVNFITEKPSKSLNINAGIRGNTIGYNRVDAKVSGTVGNTGLYLSSYKSQVRDGVREYGDFDKSAITAKVTHQFSDNLSVDNSLTYINYESDMSGSIKKDAFEKGDFSSIHRFTFRDVNSLRVKSKWDYKWNDENSSILNIYYRKNSIKQNPSYRISDFKIKNGTSVKDGELNDNSFESYGAVLQHNITFSNKFKMNLGAVVDYSPNKFKAEEIEVFKNSEGIFDKFNQLGTYKSDYSADILNIGGYVAGEYKLSELFRLNFGGRFDSYEYDFENSKVDGVFQAPNSIQNFSAITPRLGLVFKNKNYGAYTNYSTGFVPPSVGEQFRQDITPNLVPATYNNYELGGFRSFFNNSLYADVAMYYFTGKDEVVNISPNRGTFDYVNIGKTEHYGIEYMIEYRVFRGLSIKNSGSFSKHKYIDFIEKGVDFSGNDIKLSPGLINNLNISYKPSRVKNLRIGLEWQSVGGYYSNDTNTSEYNGYNVFNLRAGYKYKQFDVWTNFMNVLDKNFATRVDQFGNYTPGNPRNITVGIRYSLK